MTTRSTSSSAGAEARGTASPLRLVVVRHAKSVPKDSTSDDHARALADEGRRAAEALSGWFAKQDWRPDLALVSDARRTEETWELLQPGAGASDVRLLSGLYNAEARSILDILRREGRGRTVLLVGHNPGHADFVTALASSPPDHPGWADQPTGATTLFEFDLVAWKDVDWGKGRVAEFVVPKDLEEGRKG